MFSPQRLSARCWAGQMTGSRCIQHFRSRARRAQPVAAGAEEPAGCGNSAAVTPASSTDTEPVREAVTFVQYDGTPICVDQLTQGKPDSLLGRWGARGFLTADGSRSRALSRLPEGGPVRLSYWVRPCSLVVGGVDHLPYALLSWAAWRLPIGCLEPSTVAGDAPPFPRCPAPPVWLRCPQWKEDAVSQGPTEQELEPLREFVRSVTCEENDNFVIPLPAGPFEYPDGDVRCRGCACLD